MWPEAMWQRLLGQLCRTSEAVHAVFTQSHLVGKDDGMISAGKPAWRIRTGAPMFTQRSPASPGCANGTPYLHSERLRSQLGYNSG